MSDQAHPPVHPPDLETVLQISGIDPSVIHYLWDEYQAEGGNEFGDFPFTIFTAHFFADAAFAQVAADGQDIDACKRAYNIAYNLLCDSFGVSPEARYAVVEVEPLAAESLPVDQAEDLWDESELHG